MKLTGIVHCHSTYSYDGKMTLKELRELCIQKGVEFVCMTEHTDEMDAQEAKNFVEECEALSDEQFRFIPGFEVPYHSAHILMVGMRSFHDIYAPDIETLRKWSIEASFVVLAHPVRNKFTVDDGLLGEIDALEVWNQQYEGKQVPRIRSLRLLRSLREKKKNLVATGGVDFHRIEHFGAPLLTLDADSLDETVIIEKLKTGAFTISSAHAEFYGTLPDIPEKISAYRVRSFFNVFVITFGKKVNALLALLGLSLPKSLKEKIRKTI